MKRWYQLSLLQMLVATGMVAVLLAANSTTECRPCAWTPSNHELIAVEWYISEGWPFHFREAIVQGSEQPNPFDVPVRWHLFVGDISIALIIKVRQC